MVSFRLCPPSGCGSFHDTVILGPIETPERCGFKSLMTVKSQILVSSKYSVAPLFKYGNEELKMQKHQFYMVHSKNQPKCPTQSFLDVSIFVHHPRNLPTLSVAFLFGPVVRSIVLFKSGPRVGRSWAQLLHLECACETCWNGGPGIFGIFSECRDFCFTPVRIRNSYT